ncbi:ABC transporter ATP-binding protein [Polycladomyces sp. WAk]|uniref:ABC transporter ATP-binding protein n=1 Tax=Polycladomyces zharkentensis TaxID=2807616 RepID=A0ABS2WK84_9BACL|nr:ABC transporter ATP-binding protein [Polycladomyces sp. WAk]MBN2909946.1 ABC transporter ATP-binding protein [Polycladomyces sp. WAk]
MGNQSSQYEKGGADRSMVEVRGLVKRYDGVAVVDGVTFNVKQGEIFGLLGPNGAGKTTTMEMIEGLRVPDEGEIRIAGLDAVRERDRVKHLIGLQLQSTALFGHMTVREMILLYSSFYPQARPVEELLTAFDLQEKRNTWVKHLSGGQKQRLAIALAVVHDPQVLFLDEPTTGLDPGARRALWDIILRLRDEGRTVFLSTHYMEEAEQLCDRVAIMHQGKIIALDTPAGLIRRLDVDSVVEFVWESELDPSPLAALGGVKEVRRSEDRSVMLLTERLPETLRDLITWSETGGVPLSGLRTRTATLEDVFLHYTGKRLT